MAEQIIKELKIIRNKSFSFILPFIKLNNYKYIINSYLGDIDKDSFGDKIYVLYSEKRDETRSNPNYIEEYEVDNGYMYVFRIPESKMVDYEKFLIGKYSLYSDKSKEELCEYACRNSKNKPHQTQMYSILYRTDKRKKELEDLLDVVLDHDAEYVSIFNPESELYGN